MTRLILDLLQNNKKNSCWSQTDCRSMTRWKNKNINLCITACCIGMQLPNADIWSNGHFRSLMAHTTSGSSLMHRQNFLKSALGINQDKVEISMATWSNFVRKGKGKGMEYSNLQTSSTGTHVLYEAGTRFSNLRGMQGWVDLVGWLHTEIVYLSKDSHPCQY